MTELAPIMKRECPRLPPTPENTLNWFLDRVKLNLHVVICFSPIGETFQIRSLKFPALVSGCTIDWFSPSFTCFPFIILNPFQVPTLAKGSIGQCCFSLHDLLPDEVFGRYKERPFQDNGLGAGLRGPGLPVLFPEVPPVNSCHPQILPQLHIQLQRCLHEEAG